MISSSFAAVLKKINGRDVSNRVKVELNWDEDNDPLAVQMIFAGEFMEDGEDVVWVFALDLLKNGCAAFTICGQGDVRFRRISRQDGLLVCLKSPEGHADLMFPRKAVTDFLARVDEEAVFHDEDNVLENQIDELIEEILNS